MAEIKNPDVLKITRKFSVPCELLYKAWTDPVQLQKWHAPGDMIVKEASADVVVGGQYKIMMASEKGSHTVIGEYKEVVPNKKLMYTWKWQDEECGTKEPNETLVTLDFIAIDENNSELHLMHERFTSEESRIDHNKGWEGCLANLTLKGLV